MSWSYCDCLLRTFPVPACSDSEDQPLVTIPGVLAAQVLGEQTTILSEGTLSLVLMPQSDHSTEPVLTLTVGKAAFTLHKTTLFGTVADNDLVYVFRPEVTDTSIPAQRGYVCLMYGWLAHDIVYIPDT